MRSRLLRTLDAASALANVALLAGSPAESISGRAYRCGWRHARRWINRLFWWQVDHCRSAHLNDLDAAAELLLAPCTPDAP